MKSQAIETKKAGFLGCVKFITDNRMVERFEMHPDLMSSASLWFSFKESNISFGVTFEHFEVSYRVSFLSSRSTLGRPFFKISNTSRYR